MNAIYEIIAEMELDRGENKRRVSVSPLPMSLALFSLLLSML